MPKRGRMSKETDEFFRRGVKYGFRAGYYSAVHEIQEMLHSAKSYDTNEKRVDREVHHMKDVNFDGGIMSYRVSDRRIKDRFRTNE